MTCCPPPAAPTNIEHVKLLFDYTKFHLSMYTTLASLLVVILNAHFAKSWTISRKLIGTALVAIVLAGLAGGVVASSMPILIGKPGNLYEEPIGPLCSHFMTVEHWTWLEHSSFWLAIVCIVIACWQRSDPPQLRHAESDELPL
jgi:hypothetical protein